MAISAEREQTERSARTRILARWSNLLRLEAEAQRVQSRQQPGMPLADGLSSSRSVTGAIYMFETLTDALVPEGSKALLRVDQAEYSCEVLHRGDDEITLYVEPSDGDLPSVKVPSATLRSEPWFLIEALAARLDDLTDTSPSLALQTFLQRPSTQPEPVAAHEVPPAIDLNPRQEEAVAAALVEPLWWVWGPPGTGKTRTLGALVAEATVRGERLLVTAHSNVAVDTAMIAAADEIEVRGSEQVLVDGTVVRAGPAVVAAARDRRLSARDQVLDRNPTLARELADTSRRLRSPGLSSAEVASLRSRLAELRAEVRRLERELVSGARVVFCTLPKAAIDEAIFGRAFDAAAVDEASMAFPAQVALAASLAEQRLTVLGDFCQLPPIVTSSNPEVQAELGRDAFAFAGISVSVRRGSIPGDVSMLTTQHRMHPVIRAVVSELSYLGRLDDGRRVAGSTEPGTRAEPAPGSPIVVVNTRLLGGRGWRTPEWSRVNPMSAVWAVQLAAAALDTVDSVALLAPYRGQVHAMTALIRDLKLRDRVTVGTIHRMQGAEAEAVVFDLVDGPPLGVPGRLLHEPLGQRLVNVAFSRAKSKLVVLGDAHVLRPAEHFTRTGSALAALYKEHGWAPPQLPRCRSEPKISWVGSADDAVATYARDIRGNPAVAWVGSRAPSWVTEGLVALRPPATPAQPDQAIVLVGDVAWILGETPARRWTGWRVEGIRFVDALFDVLHGRGRRPLTRCPMHGVPVVVSARGSSVLVTCPTAGCTTRRRAGAADLDLWAIYLDHRCNSCGAVLTAALGGHGWFYRCPGRCRFTAPIS